MLAIVICLDAESVVRFFKFTRTKTVQMLWPAVGERNGDGNDY